MRTMNSYLGFFFNKYYDLLFIYYKYLDPVRNCIADILLVSDWFDESFGRSPNTDGTRQFNLFFEWG